MQWLIDLIIEAIGIPPVYIDRGDPGIADYAVGDFTKDGDWHELDLSAIVPENATTVLFTIRTKADSIAATFEIRRHGNEASVAVSRITTPVANVRASADLVCAVDADRKTDYATSPDFLAIFDIIFLTVKGWWL